MTSALRRSLLVALCLTLPVAAGCGFFGRKPTPEEERRCRKTIASARPTRSASKWRRSPPAPAARRGPGRRVAVHYTGWLFHPDKPANHGRQFDSSRDRGEPIEFTLGQREVIPGWDRASAG